MDKNPLVYGLIFGLILSPLFIFIELKIFSFLIKLLKFNIKYNKPVEVLSLIISELLAVLFSIRPVFDAPSFYSILVIIFLLVKIYGLWNLKKWVLYVYIIFMLFTFSNINLLGSLELKTISVSLPIQLIILLVYYFYVYKPNKKLFK